MKHAHLTLSMLVERLSKAGLANLSPSLDSFQNDKIVLASRGGGQNLSK